VLLVVTLLVLLIATRVFKLDVALFGDK
jgi:hypothetical protein